MIWSLSRLLRRGNYFKVKDYWATELISGRHFLEVLAMQMCSEVRSLSQPRPVNM